MHSYISESSANFFLKDQIVLIGLAKKFFGFLYTFTEHWLIQYFGLYEPSDLYCNYSALLEAA